MLIQTGFVKLIMLIVHRLGKLIEEYIIKHLV